MSLPEISRRCLACGASVRVEARFCPQCGAALAAEEAEADAKARGAEPSEPGPRAEIGPGWAAPAPLARASDAAPDGPRELSRTREVETPASGTAPATRDLFATMRDDALAPDAPLRATREVSSHTPPGGAQGTSGAAGRHERARGVSEDGGVAARTRGAAARVRETVMPRVEKMREEALVVLDEAPDDSGLRFVLIAVVLFLLFLLFLLLSTTILR